jgi:ABC-type transport system substrate-binding protein
MPYLDGIELQVQPDVNNQLAEFRTGGSHNLGGTLGWPAQLRDVVRDTIDGVQELMIPNLGNFGPLLNSNRFPDQRLRQSLSLGIDRPDLLNLYEAGIISSPISAGFGDLVMGHENFEMWQMDKQRARNLLDAAGYPDGLALDMLIGPYGGAYLLLAEAVVTQLRDVGWNLDIHSPPYADWIGDFFTKPNHDIAFGTTSPRPPVDFQVWGHYNSASGGNFVHATDPELDRLTDLVRFEVDNAARAEKLADFQEYIADQVYWATTVLEPRFFYIQSYVRDMRRGAGAAFFANVMQKVWFDEV